MPYLTPQRFRTMGFGLDISEDDDAVLTALIAQASSVVDAYCNIPRIPQKHDFRGGSVTGEQHSWRYPTTPFEIGQRRFYAYHWPILAVSQFRIYVTNTQYVEIAPSELMINNSEKYLEVVSLALTSSGLFNALIIPNVGLATPIAKCDYTYGWSFSETGEELSQTDGRTFMAQNQFWHSDPAPVIKKNGVVTSSGFTINSTEGTVVFDTQLAASDVVTASYSYKLPPNIQYASAHIVAYLHGHAELHGRGMAHLTKLRVAEVEMERRPTQSGSVAAGLGSMVPEAAVLLDDFRADNLTVR